MQSNDPRVNLTLVGWSKSMDLRDAAEFIRPAVEGSTGVWADCGAGTGLFTNALLVLLGPGSRVYCIDQNAARVRDLQRLDAAQYGSEMVAIRGDIRHLNEIRELTGVILDGALFANSLHFIVDPASALTRASMLIRPAGRIVVVEYDRGAASPWVPFPITPNRLDEIAAQAGMLSRGVVARRPSAFRGTMYCALLSKEVKQ